MDKEKKTQKKLNDTQTIELDMESLGLLRASQDALQKILRKKKVSYSQVIKVIHAVTHLQDELINMQLEESPFKKEEKKPESEDTSDKDGEE